MEIKKLRRWNNAIHRDLGYLFFGMTLIYAISGIVLNHFKAGDFSHPDYSRSYKEFYAPLPGNKPVDQAYVNIILDQAKQKDHYKSYITGDGYVQIFLKEGSIFVNLSSGQAQMETRSPRYIIKEFNLLHYNNLKKLYTWFSDLYAVALIFMAITGLFVLKGKNGILKRGAWLTALGLILPALFLLFYR